MARDLYALLDLVQDEASFIAFVEALAADFEEEQEIERTKPSSPHSSGALGWENGTIGAMLGAAAAWANSSAMNSANKTAAHNPWRRCAHILFAGKFYE
jgi:hypothetical protein